jgi:hypothetical protein
LSSPANHKRRPDDRPAKKLMLLREGHAEFVRFALGEMKPRTCPAIGSKSRDLNEPWNPKLGASLEKHLGPCNVDGLKTIGPVALEDASCVNDGVDTLKALPPVFQPIAGEIAGGHFPGGKHETKTRRVSPAGDNLVSGPRSLYGDVLSDKTASTGDQNPHGLTPLASSSLPGRSLRAAGSG